MNAPESLEVWAPIAGYGGAYEVSSHGRVRSLGRMTRTNRFAAQRFRPGAELKLSLDRKGYLQCTLSHDGQSRTIRVHRLVALAFVPQSSADRGHVNHRDYDRTNNRAENLEWVTPRENFEWSRERHAEGNRRPEKLAKQRAASLAMWRRPGFWARRCGPRDGVAYK